MSYHVTTFTRQKWKKTFLFFIFVSLQYHYHEAFILLPCKCSHKPSPSSYSQSSYSFKLYAKQKKNIQNKKGKRSTQHHKLKPMEYEKSLQKRGYNYIIGTDEVGRGSIAGPVLAVSCCIVNNVNNNVDNGNNYEQEGGEIGLIQDVNDSKVLTENQRLKIYNQIHNNNNNNNNKNNDNIQNYYKYSISQRSPKQIEKTNILKATMECFQESIQNLILTENLPLHETYAIVDGKSTPKLVNGVTPIPCRPYVNADKYIYTVSIASILAKVIRDDIMVQASLLYPEYGFDVNKGYSTREHIEAIHKFGPCPLHRMSFKPLQNR